MSASLRRYGWAPVVLLAAVGGCAGDEVELRGVVRGADGTPRAGVELTAPPEVSAGTITTGDDGRYVARLDLSHADYRSVRLAWNRTRLWAIGGLDDASYDVPPLVDWPGELAVDSEGFAELISWRTPGIEGEPLAYELVADGIDGVWAVGGAVQARIDRRITQDFATSVEVVARSVPGGDLEPPFDVETRSEPITLAAGELPGSRGAPCTLRPEPATPPAGCPLTDGPGGSSIKGLEGATIDLGSVQTVSAIALLGLTMHGTAIESPNGVAVWLSETGEGYEQVGFDDFQTATHNLLVELDEPALARYVLVSRSYYLATSTATYDVQEVGVFP